MSDSCIYYDIGCRCELTPEEKFDNGTECQYEAQCESGRCDGPYVPGTGYTKTCRGPRVQEGESCQDDVDCEDDRAIRVISCQDNVCKRECSNNSDCDTDTQHCPEYLPYPRYCDPKQEVSCV